MLGIGFRHMCSIVCLLPVGGGKSLFILSSYKCNVSIEVSTHYVCVVWVCIYLCSNGLMYDWY